MARLGDVTFWKIGMRPGRPLAFGRIHSNGRSAFLFGLPGNPVAVPAIASATTASASPAA